MNDDEEGPYIFDPDWCMRPGVHLKEMLDYAGLKGAIGVRMVAKLAGVKPGIIEGILDGSVKITPEIADHLATGTQPLVISAQMWLNLERNYRDGLAAGKKDISDEDEEAP